MSVVTLEKETLVVMTELADEEISGIVGGGKDFIKAKKIDVDIDNDNDVKIGSVKGKNVTITVVNQTSTAVAFNGNAKAYNEYSNDRVYF